MKTHLQALRRANRRLALVGLGSTLLAGTIAALPKNPAYADPGRLTMTTIGLATAAIGVVGTVVFWRRRRDERLLARYARAGRSMRDTVRFLLHERRQSRRYRLSCLIALALSSSAWVLAHWPQLSALAPLRPLAGASALLFGVLLMAQPIHARRSIVNSIYLRLYLRQQAAHIGFTAPVNSTPVQEAPVTVTGPLKFRVGGFDWQFTDLQKNTIVFGEIGSGKSVSVLSVFLEALIACGSGDQKTAGLILDPKGASHDALISLCARLGRSDDLYILSAENWAGAARTSRAIALNPLDTDDDPIEVAARIIAVMKLVGGVASRDSFFLDAARGFIRHAFALLRDFSAPEPANLLDLHRLCAEPTDPGTFYTEITNTLMEKYPGLPPVEIGIAVAYFENEWCTLPDRQRSGVRSSVTQLIDDFTSEPISEMITGSSTISISDILDQGKLLYVHLPVAERERVSRVLIGLVKLQFQREVLRRPRKSRPSFMFADEFQTLFVAGEERGDSDVFERTRESNHANVVAVQNVSSLLKKVGNRNEVTNFFGLCATKIFLRNTEPETNQMASQLFGERSEIIVTASEAARLDGGWTRHQTNYSRSARSVRIIPPEAFTQLTVPVQGDPDRQFAESIVHFGSRAETVRLELRWPVHPLLP